MRGPDTRVFVVGVEENSDLPSDRAESRGETITKEGFLRVIFVLVSTARRGSEIPQVAGSSLTRHRRDDFGLLGRCVGLSRRRKVEQPSRLHGFQPDEPVEERIRELTLDVVVAPLGRALGERLT